MASTKELLTVRQDYLNGLIVNGKKPSMNHFKNINKDRGVF